MKKGKIRYAYEIPELASHSTPGNEIPVSTRYSNPKARDVLTIYGRYTTDKNKLRKKEASKYVIPYIPEKEIMLTKGRYNTGRISTNVLDSIYDAAERTNTDIGTALGLAGRESTLGIGRGFKNGSDISGTDLYSNWQQVQTVYNTSKEIDKYNILLNKYNNHTPLSDEEVNYMKSFLLKEKKAVESTKPLEENPIDNALKYYKTGNYNKGDKNYSSKIKQDAELIMQDPAIKNWLKTKNMKNKFPTGGPMGKIRQYTPSNRRALYKKSKKDLSENPTPEDVNTAYGNTVYDDAREYANWWYDERAVQPKYAPQLPPEQLQAMKDRLSTATYDTSKRGDKFVKASHAVRGRDNETPEYREKLARAALEAPWLGGAASPEDNIFWTRGASESAISHEGIGHIAGDLNPEIMKRVPKITPRTTQYDGNTQGYLMSPNERNAQTWDFRYTNRDLKDDNGNYYIDPNRQLSPSDIQQMREKGARFPTQWKNQGDSDISTFHNTIADTGSKGDNPFGTNMAAYGGNLFNLGGPAAPQWNIQQPNVGKLTSPVAAPTGGGGGGLLKGLAGGLGGMGGGMLSGISSGISGAISGGMSTGVGGAMQAIGGIASNIPGVGGLIGAGVNVLGGLVNRAFGSQINDEFVNETKENVTNQLETKIDDSSFDSVLEQQATNRGLDRVSRDQVGKDGWFSKKAKNLTNDLNKKIENANAALRMNTNNAFDNVKEQQSLDVLANYSAFGGPLYADGGGIHIKKANRGKFTEYCGGKVTSECIRRGKNSSSPAVRKRATFAQNARNWHADGGFLGIHGGDFSNGITIIGEGGTHEQNPYEGIQIGTDPQGKPNLVEEGEVIFNDYVFSNRLKVPKKDRKRLRLREGTFADAAEKLQKESAERPNDPISKRGLETSMGRLASIQERIRERKRAREGKNKFADGGPYKTYKNFENIKDDWYTPEYMGFVNSLKEGDSGSRAWLDRINSEEFGPVGGNKFTDIPDIQRLATDRKKGPVHNAMSRAAQSYSREQALPQQVDFPQFDLPDSPERVGEESMPVPQQAAAQARGDQKSLPTWMRYAPVAGSAMGVINDAFRDTDYSNAESVRGSYQATPDIGFTPVNNKLTYRPLDTNYEINKLDANTAAQRRAITNTSGGNRATAMAGLLAANNSYGNQMGDLYRQAEEYNQAQKERVEGFNRQTNMYNSEGKFKADASNQQSRAANADRKFRNAATVAQMRHGIHDNDTARRDANISGLLQGLGDIGYENFGMNMANSNPALQYGIGKNGRVNKKKKGGRIVR